ncbi:MAG TPA: multicopper oxidase domain-containing protein [Candidatus Acidoferrum sp.]|jgi:FtsP/CotA-like multicopper oxidase with cupredoxin domain
MSYSRIFCSAIAVATLGVPRAFPQTKTPTSNPPAATHASPHKQPTATCLRAPEGSTVAEPADLRSQNGLLKVALSFRSDQDTNGQTRYCYIATDGAQAPNLRLNPGDTLILTLKNEIPASIAPTDATPSVHPNHTMPQAADQASNSTQQSRDICSGSPMTATATNLHFHGLVLPPTCHQDDTLKTLIEPTDRPFQYKVKIPADAPPGLYWYHPHPHGFSKAQVLGGASGALIIEGIEQTNPALTSLPERVLIIRDQDLVHPNAEPVASLSMPAPIVLRDAEGDAMNTGTGGGKPAKDLSINFIPVSYPAYQPAILPLRPLERQLWRVLNASAITYLDLQLLVDDKPQLVGVVALDGLPFNEAGTAAPKIIWQSHITMPPAGRAEFIIKGLPAGAKAALVTRTVDTGPVGENDPTRPIATVEVAANAPEPRSKLPSANGSAPTQQPSQGLQPREPQQWLGAVKPVRERKLYFSEEPLDPKDPNSPTKFYITVEGQTPKQFDMNATAPNLIVQQGDVEDWIIENRTRELHAFHIHQIHFLLTMFNGVPLDEPFLRDTVNVAYWDGQSPQYPSVKLRMDFRDPAIIGTFPYHCHLLEHEDGGMMGTIQVIPRAK